MSVSLLLVKIVPLLTVKLSSTIPSKHGQDLGELVSLLRPNQVKPRLRSGPEYHLILTNILSSKTDVQLRPDRFNSYHN